MYTNSRIIAITGGIGVGKSVICRILINMGYPVYDCDYNAKVIMDNNDDIKNKIYSNICNEAIVNGQIDRKKLSDVVFGNDIALNKLNNIVHTAVKEDILSWITNKNIAFIETAILYQSGLDKIVNEVWEITAPTDLRIKRVMDRNSISCDEVKKRIDAQSRFITNNLHSNIKSIINDGIKPIIPQIEQLLQ